MVKKSEVLAKLNAKDEADYRAIVARCDAALSAYDGKKSVVVDVDGYSDKAIDRAILNYSQPEYGWTVERDRDGNQRDPWDNLVFS